MKQPKDRYRPNTRMRAIIDVLVRPQTIILMVTLVLLWRVFALGQLVYGDIPFFDLAHSKVNFLYSWGPEQLGTSVRQGLNTLRDVALVHASFSNTMFYFLKYVLPLILIPISYFYIYRKLDITNRFALIAGSLLPLCTPVVFGDFITGQTFWIYLTVPWVVYCTIQIFCLYRFTLRNYLLLGIALFLSMGMLPPIIVPLMASLGIFIFFTFIASPERHKLRLARQYCIAGFVAFMTFLLLSAPYLLVASSGKQAYTPASLLGDYYHNYSGTYFLNIFRLAGNNGNGQSTLGYNNLSITNIFGYLLFILTTAGAVAIATKRKSYRYQSAIIGLLATLLVLFGFLNFMAIDMDLGAVVFQSQWIVSTIRNPSKVYIIMLAIFAFLLTFCLQNMLERIHAKTWRIASCTAIMLIIVLYGWPVLHGDLGLLFNREDKLSTYKQDPVVRAIANAAPRDKRSLLLPSNHRDELNYQNLNPGLNTLRLEGGMPATGQLLTQLRTSLNRRDGYFFNYATAAGVGDVFIKKDARAYGDMPFSLLSVNLSPDQTKQFVQEHARVTQETDTFWHLSTAAENSLVFSPREITFIKDSDALKAQAPFFRQNTAVTTNMPEGFRGLSSTYAVTTSIKEGDSIANGKAQLYDPSLLIGDLYTKTVKGLRTVNLDILNPLDNTVQKNYQQTIPGDAAMLFLNEQWYGLSDQPKRIALRADDYDVQSGTVTKRDIGPSDPSFEAASPDVHDATPTQKGSPIIAAESNSDATNGKQSLLLRSGNHTAFVQKDLAIPDTNTNYMLTFKYKHIEGQDPSFAVMQDGYSLLSSSGQLASDSPGWQTNVVYVTPDPSGSKVLQVFFYTTGNQKQSSKNLFDDIQLYQISQMPVGSWQLPSYPSDYELTNYTHHALQQPSLTNNLLSNGSFEDDALWGTVGDASAGASGEPHLSATAQKHDAVDGKASLELSSSNHTAYVSRAVTHFEPNTVYKVSFYYKHITGHNPSFAIWQSGTEIARPSKELRAPDAEWHYYETYFVPERGATGLTLYLYSASTGKQTVNLYDNIVLEQTSLIESYINRMQPAAMPPTDIVKGSTRINPALLQVQARAGKGLLVFNESYHAGWQAYIVADPNRAITVRDKLMLSPPGTRIRDHVTINGFANGWWVDSSAYGIHGDYTILLMYTPQKNMYGGFLAMFGSGIGIGMYLLYSRRKLEPEGWRWR